MKSFKIFFTSLLIALFIFTPGKNLFSQDSPVLCDNYDSLYKTITDGNAASIIKTVLLKDFSLTEKSLITVIPVTEPKKGYEVIFKITDLFKGNGVSADEGSVLGFMTTGCRNFAKNYRKFINASCKLTADSPEAALDAVKSGIDFTIDMNYVITGDLVTIYQKTCASDTHKPTPVKKPAVYLYPEKDMKVSVKVIVNGNLTLTEPLYNGGWNVNSTPEGLIDGKYDYLFYEANLNKIELPEEGWVVAYSDLEKWFDECLPAMGLNKKETSQFKDYWLKDLRKSNYYEIRLLGNDFLENNMKLVISPEPQTIVRLNFHFKPVNEMSVLKAPVIYKTERKGFTVIEWGGINEGDLRIIP